MSVRRVVPVLSVPDVSVATGYAAVLGLDVVMDHGWIVTLADPDHRHQVSLMTKDATAQCNPNISIEVADVDAAHEAALAAGARSSQPVVVTRPSGHSA